MEKPEKVGQQAFPQTNHVHVAQNSPQPESLHRADREESCDNGIRLAPGDEVRYGIEIQVRPGPSAPEERGEGLSPDPVNGAAHNNGQPTVIQLALPPEQNGNLVYQRGFVSQKGTEKHVQRKNTRAQVEQWVKVQKGDPPKRSVWLCSFKYSLWTPTAFLSTAASKCFPLVAYMCIWIVQWFYFFSFHFM